MKDPNKRTYWMSRRIWKAYRHSGIAGAKFNGYVGEHCQRK